MTFIAFYRSYDAIFIFEAAFRHHHRTTSFTSVHTLNNQKNHQRTSSSDYNNAFASSSLYLSINAASCFLSVVIKLLFSCLS